MALECRICGTSGSGFSLVGSVRADGRDEASVTMVVGRLGEDTGDGMEENSLLDGEGAVHENKFPSLAKAGEMGDLGGASVVSIGVGRSTVC